MKRSTLLTVIGVYLALCGLVYLVSPPLDPATGEKAYDPFTLLASVWLLASGVGIFLHRVWGFWLYIAGLLIAIATMIVSGMRYDYEWSQTLTVTLIIVAVFGVPALLIWLKRDRLQAGFWRDTNA